MLTCTIGGVRIGPGEPARLMGVINGSPESFYPGSYVPPASVRRVAEQQVEAGAAILDVGARSTAPGSPPITAAEEAGRMDALLAELDGAGFVISVDTSRPAVLETCLGHDVHMLNDIGGLADPILTARAGEAGLAACGMASFSTPGDACGVEATLEALDLVAARAAAAGIDRLDPRPRGRPLDRREDSRARLGALLCLRPVHGARPPGPRGNLAQDVPRSADSTAARGAARRLARCHGVAAREGSAPRPHARRRRDGGPAPGAKPDGGLPVTTAFAVHALGTRILVPGDDLAGALLDAVARTDAGALREGDVVVVAETAVATVEGSVIALDRDHAHARGGRARPPVRPRPAGRTGGS